MIEISDKVEIIEISGKVEISDKVEIIEISDEVEIIEISDKAEIIEISDKVEIIEISGKIEIIEISDKVEIIEISDKVGTYFDLEPPSAHCGNLSPWAQRNAVQGREIKRRILVLHTLRATLYSEIWGLYRECRRTAATWQ